MKEKHLQILIGINKINVSSELLQISNVKLTQMKKVTRRTKKLEEKSFTLSSSHLNMVLKSKLIIVLKVNQRGCVVSIY
jgi:acyl-CoA hydrolase